MTDDFVGFVGWTEVNSKLIYDAHSTFLRVQRLARLLYFKAGEMPTLQQSSLDSAVNALVRCTQWAIC
ncbi:MAG: hypothetical protein PUP90_14330 [Nostoc sp. S4]|nr:hypothetical protein [Nostoc sp. S4]